MKATRQTVHFRFKPELNELLEAASDYLEKRHSIERHSEELYEATQSIRERVSFLLSKQYPIHFKQLPTEALWHTLNNINLDLYNKGLRDKP